LTEISPYTALVLAGRRGESDALASSRGASHRALLPVAGVPMLARVLTALRGARHVAKIWVSIDAPDVLASVPELAAFRDLPVHRSKESPARSVADALGELGTERVLVTTANHALLSGARVDRFLERAADSRADVAVGVVERSAFADADASAARTWIRLRCGAYTGANLFAFQHARAKNAAAFFARAERHRKNPLRMVAALGPTLAIEYLAGTLDLEAACRQVSRSAGAKIRPVLLEEAAAAIDVDKAADLALAEKILAGEAPGG
jgi:molybdopterin-guanine dinucleotide biosynthesis protein A